MLLTEEEIAYLIDTAQGRRDLVNKTIAAYEAKLLEQEPVAVVVDSDSLESVISPAVAVGSELYLHHAPIPEGLLDLLAIIHRDGGHYTDEHGIDKAINDAKDKVWAMLAAARSGE